MPPKSHRRSAAPARRRATAAPMPERLPAPLLWAGALVIALLLLLVLPAAASAQITAGLTRPVDLAARDSVVREQGIIAAARDSVAREERLDLQAWVDSAAGSLSAGADPITPIPGAPADSVVENADIVPPPPGTRPGALPPAGRQPTTTFREGAPAPDTATPLPLLAAVGGVMTAAGAWLRRRR